MEYPENPPINPQLYDDALVFRFWWRVRKTVNCWFWVGYRRRGGYGEFTYKGKTYSAHRVSYESVYGPIPEGMDICHKCDNPACIRPDHLFLGTHQDNMRDRAQKMRVPTGERHYAARLTWPQVEYIRDAYARKALTQKQLADKYGVSCGTINAIVNNRTWKVPQYG